MHTTLEPLDGTASAAVHRLKVYVRYDPQIDNTGGGGQTVALPNIAVIDPRRIASCTAAPEPRSSFVAESTPDQHHAARHQPGEQRHGAEQQQPVRRGAVVRRPEQRRESREP